MIIIFVHGQSRLLSIAIKLINHRNQDHHSSLESVIKHFSFNFKLFNNLQIYI